MLLNAIFMRSLTAAHTLRAHDKDCESAFGSDTCFGGPLTVHGVRDSLPHLYYTFSGTFFPASEITTFFSKLHSRTSKCLCASHAGPRPVGSDT